MSYPGTSLASILLDLETNLTPHTDTPLLDATLLLGHVINKPRSWILAHPEYSFTSDQFEIISKFTSRLLSGEPLPYVIGHWEFFGLEFNLTPEVLIPRPETELMVERAIDWLYANPKGRFAADIGTGSGCIAISIASRVSDLRLIATDISLPALKVAESNTQMHNLSNRITFQQADLLEFPCPSKFDMICSNLPYIPTAMLPSLDVSHREPNLALDGGRDGLELIARLIGAAPPYLKPSGILLLEIEHTQGSDATSLAYQTFPNAHVLIHQDLSGLDRLLEIHPNS